MRPLRTRVIRQAAAFDLLLVAFITSAVYNLIASDEIPGLEVKEAMFTTAIDGEKNYVKPGLQSGVHLQRGPVYLWIVLAGTNESLNSLRERKSSMLPVRHKWTYIGQGFTGSDPDSPDESEQDAEALPLGRIRHLAALSTELEGSDRRWGWRTWSGKRHFREGWYEVRVVLNNGQTLRQDGKECVYYFDFEP